MRDWFVGSISVFCESQVGERRKLIEILVKVASCRLQIAHPVRITSNVRDGFILVCKIS